MATAAPRVNSSLTSWEQRGRLLFGGLVGLAILWSFWGTIGKPDCQDMDFGAYYRAAVAVGRGESPYTLDEEDQRCPPRAKRLEGYPSFGAFPYMPAYAYLLSLLRHLDYLWACRLWMLLNWLAVAAAFWLSLSLALGGRATSSQVWGILLLAGVPIAGYLWACVRLGQIALWMTVGCLGWAWCQQRGRPFIGGLMLAAASALKLAPLALVPYLILQRDRRGLAGVAVGAVVIGLLPVAWVGWEGTLRLHQEWVHHTIATDVPLQTYRPGNQSLLGLLARLPLVSDGHELLAPENLAALKRVHPGLLAALAGALYGWILWSRRTHPLDALPQQARDRDRGHLALLFVFLTLAHPHAWRCNYVGLLFPCV
ncbi:MAG TPA: glycosyltransferase family 87 protein, partial [Gemmataceae bacterium]|nr:glycosyltransferase family 87 protein [Gemmataceae bacterium]